MPDITPVIDQLTPQQIVAELDKHIIGQANAKRAVAVALRNRWRRAQLPEELRTEVTPKNILMIGPTGVGKTEIARRLARLANAPFIKVEATKFTEVGYVGRDVDSIVRDLVDKAVQMNRESATSQVIKQAEEKAEERLLDALLPSKGHADKHQEQPSETRQKLRKQLHKGQLDKHEVDIEVNAQRIGVEIMAPPGMEEMTEQIQHMFKNLSNRRPQKRRLRVEQAMKLLTDDEAAKLIDEEDIKSKSVIDVEQNGIVFIDELDKVTRGGDNKQQHSDVSREGVQRDLLPLVEGCTVPTKYGAISTQHILFIASGAFHHSKPSDLIPELQGRMPIRVELEALAINDFVRILTEPKASLSEQYTALLATEGVQLDFAATAIKRIAEIAWEVNERTENIGARRLHTVLEKLFEELSFTALEYANKRVKVNAQYVDKHLKDIAGNEDLMRYVL